MNVLSLFDGLSAGQVALKRAGLKIDNYFACEIDKAVIKQTQKNFPDTIQLGSVLDLNLPELPKIDLVIGGPECTTYSVAGKMDSSGFWQIEKFKECVDYLKPKYFLMENVKSKSIIIERITEEMGVRPTLINSKWFSAQNRERYYWTNILIPLYHDKKILLSSISSKGELPICYSSSGRGNGKVERRMSCNKKAHTLTKTGYSNRAFSGFVTSDQKIRRFTVQELEALQTFDKGFTEGMTQAQAHRALGNSWTVDLIAHIFKGIEL